MHVGVAYSPQEMILSFVGIQLSIVIQALKLCFGIPPLFQTSFHQGTVGAWFLRR